MAKSKIHTNMELDYSIDSFNCRWSHGRRGLECQCKLEFAHAGNCKCYDKTCKQEWKRPYL